MNDDLLKDIIKEWELDSLPPEKQTDMIDRIGRMMYQALLVKSLDILSEQEQNDFDALLDKDETTPQDVLTFLKSKIPTFGQLVEEERNNLKRDLFISVA